MITEIRINLEDLVLLRRQTNEPIFAKFDHNEVEVYLTYKGIILKSKVLTTHPEWNRLKPYVNKPVSLYDKRLTSHDFGDSSTWGKDDLGNPVSTYRFEPDPNRRLSVSFIQVRFPITANLTMDCKLFFKVYLNLGNGVLPVINLEYPSILDLVRRSNSPIQIQSTILDTVSSVQMAEIEFTYADPNTLQGSPINLRASLGEYMEMGIVENTPIVDKDGLPLNNPTWAIVNGKQTVDF